jgi:very-short-patch-repair endonuclease
VCRRVFDFFCPELELVIEIDGNSQDIENDYEKDTERQQEIERLGIQFLRCNDLDVKRNMPGVLSVLEQWIEEHTPDTSQEGNYTRCQGIACHSSRGGYTLRTSFERGSERLR